MRRAAKEKTLALATAVAVLLMALPRAGVSAKDVSLETAARSLKSRVMGSEVVGASRVGALGLLRANGCWGCGQIYDAAAVGVPVSENHIVAVNPTSSNPIAILYDGDGNRVSKTVGTGASAVTTKYLVDDNNPTEYAQVVEELNSSLLVSRTYTYGAMIISQTQLVGSAWTTSFYGSDGHGSTRVLTDSSGNLTDTYDYDAFGILIHQTGSTPNVYLYSGEQFDPDLGFYYLRARYLSTFTGRFWTSDQFEGFAEDPASLHKYLYAGANPANAVDPTGNASIQEIATTALIVGILAGIANSVRAGIISNWKPSAMARGFIQGFFVGATLTVAAFAGVALLGALGVSAGAAQTILWVAFSLYGGIGVLNEVSNARTPQERNLAIFDGVLWAIGSSVGAFGAVSTTNSEAFTTLGGNNYLSPFAQLPVRSQGDKTSGILFLEDGQPIPIRSGKSGPGNAMPPGSPGFNGTVRTHVEGHAAAIMRARGSMNGVLYINNPPCPGKWGCDAMLPRMLPKGATLRVVGPNSFETTYTGK